MASLKMNAIGVIPARYKSTRFEGKVLAEICGRPMIQYVWEAAKKASTLEDVIIACDDERVLNAVIAFGGKAVLTAKLHQSGTDRISEVVNPIDVKVVVNIQADEPLLHPSMIDDITRPLLEDPAINMATLIKRIEDEEELKNANIVKVVKDRHDFALYFSRFSIPYIRQASNKTKKPVFYKHIGLYSYTKDFLFTFTHLLPSDLENAEALEQLRVLENGYRIKVVETNFDTIGVDTPEDIARVERILKNKK